MKELIIKDKRTGLTENEESVIAKCTHILSWEIRKYNSNWVLDIVYFDLGAEQENRDSMILCEAHSEFWNDDLRVQIREEIWDPEKEQYVLS